MSESIYNFLKNQKQIQLKSQGKSMLPLLQPNDILYFKKISFQKVKINDLVMVRKRRQIFTHRVIYKSTEVFLGHSAKKSYIVTKGDSNIVSDGRIYPKQIIAKVEKVKRNDQVFRVEDIYLLQSTQYFQEIVIVKKALEEEKIDFVFLKGLPLHLHFEKLHPRRVYADCDVLVANKNRQKADLILKKQGFRKVDTSYSKFHKLLKDKETELVYVKNIKNFPVVFDMHLEASFLMHQLGRLNALYPQYLIDKMTEQFLKEKKYVKIQGDYFPILSPANLIIYLSLHIFHHNFRGVFRLEFLDKVLRKSLQIPESQSGESFRHLDRGHDNGRVERSSIFRKLEDSSTSLGMTTFQTGFLIFSRLSNKILDYHVQNFVYPVFLLLKKYYRTPLPDSFLDSIKPENTKMDYIRKNILKIDIFDDETRIKAGMNRFRNLFYLSPNPLWRRLLIVLNPQVIYSFFWVIIFFAKRSLISSSKSA